MWIKNQNIKKHAPFDVLFVRDDDIPSLVVDGTCDLGIIGENVLLEQAFDNKNKLKNNFKVAKKLGFSQCRLSIAIPTEKSFRSPECLEGLRIATSYPNLLLDYLKRKKISAEIIGISGSVEVAPQLDMADAICDLVATGKTLEENNLKEVDRVIQSEAVLIKTKNTLNPAKKKFLNLFINRVESVLMIQASKCVMFNAPRSSLDSIRNILPFCKTPTVMPIEGINGEVAVCAVSNGEIFWGTLEKLKLAGASSILVFPIEKMLS